MRKYWLYYLVYTVLAILIYLPVLNKSFAADDFSVLYRLIHDRNFLAAGFFRPVADLFLYSSFLYSGIHQLGYNLTNVLIHAANAFILCRILLVLSEGNKNGSLLSFTGGLLFLFYPFHNEAVVWVVGRGAMLATTFSCLVIWISLRHHTVLAKTIGFVLYTLALGCYETVLLLPLIVGLLLYLNKKPTADIFSWMAVLFSALAINLLVRNYVMQYMVGDYADRVLEWQPAVLLPKIIKVFGRFWLPPTTNTLWLILSTLAIGIAVAALFIYWFRKNKQQFRTLSILFTCFLLGAVVAFLFGVNTRTIEGERVMYFGSFFLCAWLAWLLSGIKPKGFYTATMCLLLGYFVFFLADSNQRWKIAGERTARILQRVAALHSNKAPILISNLPEEYRGALMLRNGFYPALLLQGTDTAHINIVSCQGSSIAQNPDQPVLPIKEGNVWRIGENKVPANPNLYYWNNMDLLPLK